MTISRDKSNFFEKREANYTIITNSFKIGWYKGSTKKTIKRTRFNNKWDSYFKQVDNSNLELNRKIWYFAKNMKSYSSIVNIFNN